MVQEERSLSDANRFALTVLEMVQVLHQRGYERLRIVPGMSPSGMAWRCSVTHGGNIQPDHGAMAVDFDKDTAHYTSAAGEQYFDWEDATGDTPDRLADKFEARYPRIVRFGTGRDPEYVAWYKQMLELARHGAFPIAYDDDYDERDPRWLPTTEGVESGLPMPPV